MSVVYGRFRAFVNKFGDLLADIGGFAVDYAGF